MPWCVDLPKVVRLNNCPRSGASPAPSHPHNNENVVIAVVSNKDQTVQAILTSSKLWMYGSGRDDRLIGELTLPDTCVNPIGVIWNNDDQHIAIIGAQSVHIYRIDTPPPPPPSSSSSVVVLNGESQSASTTTTSLLHAQQLTPVTFVPIKSATYHERTASFTHVCPMKTVLLVTTTDGCVYAVSWRCRIGDEPILRTPTTTTSNVQCFSSCEPLSLVAIGFDTTTRLFKFMNAQQPMIEIGRVSYCASVVAFDARAYRMTLAHECALEHFHLRTILDRNEPHALVNDTSVQCDAPVRCLQWSSQHGVGALAVLLINRQIDVWSSSERRTYTTASRYDDNDDAGAGAGHAAATAAADNNSNNHDGNRHHHHHSGGLVWGAGCFHLYHVHGGTAGVNVSRYNFVRQVDSAPVLLGSENVIVWRGRHDGSSVDSDWEHLEIPSAYISMNWPMRFVRSSPLARKHLLVAGTRGFIVYNRGDGGGKWRCFGNVNHEQQLMCLDACWVDERWVVIANAGHQQRSRTKRRGVDQCELLVYSRTHLSNARIRAQLALPASLLCMSVERHTILAHLVTGDLVVVDLSCGGGGGDGADEQVVLSIRHHIQSPFTSLPAQSSLWRRYNGHTDEYDVRYLLLEPSGTLFAIDLASAATTTTTTTTTPTATAVVDAPLVPPSHTNECRIQAPDISVVSTNVHAFALSPLLSNICRVHTAHMHLPPNELMSPEAQLHRKYVRRSVQRARRETSAWRLFTFGELGVHVWLPRCLSAVDMNPYERNVPSSIGDMIALQVNEPDMDSMTVGVDSMAGVLVRLTNRRAPVHLSVADAHKLRSYFGTIDFPRLEAIIRPYLPPVLTHMIACQCTPGQDELALHVATDCRWHTLFDISLELMLHECLQWSSSRVSSSSNDALLHRVLEFLRQLPEYLAILVNTARKVDMWQWQRLFALTQTPSELLLQCLKSQQYETASHYLLLVQRTEGVQQARQMAARILNDSIVTRHVIGGGGGVNGSGVENVELTRALTRFLEDHVLNHHSSTHHGHGGGGHDDNDDDGKHINY